MDTGIKLRWSEPRSPNGILQGYQIVIHDVGKDLNETRRLGDLQANMEYTINELTPFTWYTFYVQAFSRKYQGEPSQPIKSRTDVSSPTAPQSVNVTCYAGETTTDSILVQWSKPEKFYDKIDYYYVAYKTDSASEYTYSNLTAKRDRSAMELLIADLTPNLLYEFKVIAGTKSHHDPNLVYKSEQSPILRVVLQAHCESK